jgi:drug/metabolite transporter (DMT)-like permease
MISKNISIITLVLCIFFTAFGHYYFKIFFKKKKTIQLIKAIILFLCIPIFANISLQNLSLSTVYVSMAFTNVLILMIAKNFLNEKINQNMYLGSLFVITGILFFNS